MNTILITGITVGGIGAAAGAALAVASRFLSVRDDPRVEKVAGVLPGVNCGGCGYAGCADYAKAIVLNDAPINLCSAGGQEVLEKVAEVMGKEADAEEKKAAIVLCGGDLDKAPRRFEYNGVADCAAAAAVDGGDKACGYGCLGYGSCARVCPVGAIEIKHCLAYVHPDVCIGCGACVNACPRGLIKLVPVSRQIHVVCSSKDRGAAVKKVCKVGCIGCTKCAKNVDSKQITMDGALAVVDYDKPLENEKLVELCPGNCIVKRKLQ
ncbi:MAG: RnfABCDGE type electron transport complex subunit B [Kiritimatiellia bacterium]